MRGEVVSNLFRVIKPSTCRHFDDLLLTLEFQHFQNSLSPLLSKAYAFVVNSFLICAVYKCPYYYYFFIETKD